MTTATATATPKVRIGRVKGVEYFVHGQGLPVSLFIHGLAGSAAEMQPLAVLVAGTRVMLNFRGHGRSDDPAPEWDYDDLAADVLAVADEVGATRAVGLSMGAAALLRAVTAGNPDRFERLAFLLPVSVESEPGAEASRILEEMAALARGGATDALVDRMLQEVPAELSAIPAARTLAGRRARLLVRTPPPDVLAHRPPVADLADLDRLKVRALVVAQEGDPVHDADVARHLWSSLPAADLLVLPPYGAFWTARDVLQDRLAGYLA
jgi:hypothetical protein